MGVPALINPTEKPFAAALAIGLLHSLTFALAFPPIGAWPLLFVTVLPLIVIGMTTQKPKRSAFAVLLASLPAQAFLHIWVGPITWLGMPLLVVYMSLYPAAFVWLVMYVRTRLHPAAALIGGVILWPSLEFFRGEIFAQGYTWFMLADSFPLRTQNGIYLTGFYLVICSVVAMLATPLARTATHTSFPRWKRVVVSLLLCASVLAGLATGATRLAISSAEIAPTLRIAVIQTNVPQSNKQSATLEERLAEFAGFMEMTREAASADPPPDLIVWPETMVPVYLGLNRETYEVMRDEGIGLPIETADGRRHFPMASIRERLVELHREIGVPMLVGATSADGLEFVTDATGRITPETDARYNSAFLLKDGDVLDERYDKIKLTPFGEVMPGISSWPWLESQLLALGARGMTFDLESGSNRTVFEVENSQGEAFRIVTPICFEITYAATCRSLVFKGNERRADVMVNMTNDGWFGNWDPGREVHNQSARWRAAELATPVVRAANTGYSSHIGRTGNEIARLGANEAGILRVEVGKGHGTTAFSFLGFLPQWVMLGASIALLAIAWWKGRSGNSQGGDAPIADESP